MVSQDAQNALNQLEKDFTVTDDQVVQLCKAYGNAFLKGLSVKSQDVTMGPSWVTHTVDGNEKGVALTLELSWNYVRVAVVNLEGNRNFSQTFKMFNLSNDMIREDAPVFFGFLANCVQEYLQENPKSVEGAKSPVPLGFIFPFDFEKDKLNHGRLLSWSKGFSVKGAVGECAVDQLQEQLDSRGVKVRVEAIVNDTVALLLAQSYLQASCPISAVYGAGTNGGYMESGAAISKIPEFRGSSMLINTEWAAFREREFLPRTKYDDIVDQESANPGGYLFQKLTSWFYLGEISRNVFLELVAKNVLFGGKATGALKRHGSFATFHLFKIEDAGKNKQEKRDLLCELFDYGKNEISDDDLEIVSKVVELVAVRGGRLVGCPPAALLTHLGYDKEGQNGNEGKIDIAVDGEFFIGSQQFKDRLTKSIAIFLGQEVAQKLNFLHVEGKNYVGAAIAALEGANAL